MIDLKIIKNKNITSKSLSIMNGYLRILELYFKKSGVDYSSPKILFKQLTDIARSIYLLIRAGYRHISQSEIILRTLGELSLIGFVIFSLNNKSQKAYWLLYELHGWYELVDTLSMMNFEIPPDQINTATIIKDRMTILKNTVHKEFSNEITGSFDEKKLKEFVKRKISRYIFTDAETLLREKYSKWPALQHDVKKLLKKDGTYKYRSHFVHNQFFSNISSDAFNANKQLLEKNKQQITCEAVTFIHLVITTYTAHHKEDVEFSSLFQKLLLQRKKINTLYKQNYDQENQK